MSTVTVKIRLGLWLAVCTSCTIVGYLSVHLIGGLTVAPAEALTLLAAIGLGAVAWPTLRRRSAVGLVLVYGLLGFGATAALLYKPTATEFTGINALVANMADHTGSYRYLLVFVVAAFAAWSASLAVSVAFPRPRGRFLTSISLHLSPWMLAVAALPLLINVYGAGLHVVLHAEKYLEHAGPASAVSVGQALGPVGVLICGYFTFDRRQPAITRGLALILALAYEAIYLAAATRFFALWIPFMFTGGLLTGTWSARRQRVSTIFAIVIAIVALQVPLGLRGLPEHGLVPGLQYIVKQPSLVLTTHDPINNLLFGAPLTLYVAHDVGPLPASDLMTSLSPLPSFLNNWKQIAPRLRVNRRVPYSALGEMLNHGWLVFWLLTALFVAGFTLVERVALSKPGLVSGLSNMVVLGASGLFVVQSTEYNLRAAARLVYYAFVGVVALQVVLAWFQSRGSRRRFDSRHGAPAVADEFARS